MTYFYVTRKKGMKIYSKESGKLCIIICCLEILIDIKLSLILLK